MIPAALLGAGAVVSTADDIYNLIMANKQRKLAEGLAAHYYGNESLIGFVDIYLKKR